MKVTTAIICALAVAAPAAASAQVTFNVSGAFTMPFGSTTTAGTLTGSFTTNNALSAIIGYNLVASASGSFAGFTYTTQNSSVTASSLPSQYFRIDSTGNLNELQLYFPGGLTATGGTFGGSSSSEHEPSGGNRYASGTAVRQISAVPEPASWALMLVGFGAAGVALRRRLRASEVAFTQRLDRIAAGETA